MKIRTLGATAALGLACLTLAGCVDSGPGYVSSGYVYSDSGYYGGYDGGYRDRWRYRDHDRGWDRGPGRSDWHHGGDRPDRGDHNWRGGRSGGDHVGRPDRGPDQGRGAYSGGSPNGPGRVIVPPGN